MGQHTLRRRTPYPWRLMAAGAAALCTVGLLSVVPSAAAQGTGNVCTSQPRADGRDGWGRLRGGELRRDVDSPTGRVAVHQLNETLAPSVYLPQQRVGAGERWTFGYESAVNSLAVVGTHRARVEVDWYSASGAHLGHDNGPWAEVPTDRAGGWRRVAGEFTAPPGAARANVIGELAVITARHAWALAGCDYRRTSGGGGTPPATSTTVPPSPSTSAPGTSVPPVTPQPPSSTPPASITSSPPPDEEAGTTAAARLGWGPVVAGDEFDYTGRPDPARWSLPGGGSGCMAGHAGKGQRCASQAAVADGALTLTGTADGRTGWMQSRHQATRGRWETRMRVLDTPGRDDEYHPVMLLWPVAEDFPVGGEIDYAEAEADGSTVSFFLHYSASNRQTGGGSAEGGRQAVDLTAWHNYGLEWTAGCVVGYLDGTEWFRDCDPSHVPPRAMKQALQLDYFPDGSAGPGETAMQVAWTRVHA